MTIRRLLPLLFATALLTYGCNSGGLITDDDDATDDDDDDDGDDDDATDDDDVDPALAGWCQIDEDDFSFFVTSMAAIWALSGDDISDLEGGMGGDLGGIEGADALCQTIGNATGNGGRTWKAFLSATDDGNGNEVDAIDRIGSGPWHDANGRLVSDDIAGLLSDDRPDGDAQSVDDLPDECGVPLSVLGDSHDIVTGSNDDGRLASDDPEYTCNDWTANTGAVGTPVGGGGPGGNREGVICGHSFPRSQGGNRGQNWRSDHTLRGCDKGANLIQNGAGEGTCIGCSGGYGGIYCFAAD